MIAWLSAGCTVLVGYGWLAGPRVRQGFVGGMGCMTVYTMAAIVQCAIVMMRLCECTMMAAGQVVVGVSFND